MPYNSNAHRKFSIKYQIIFICKYRKELFEKKGLGACMKNVKNDSSAKLKTSLFSRIKIYKMQDFDEIFFKTSERPVKYKDKFLMRVDKFPVSDGDKLVISIEKTNSEYIQGVSIDITGSCEINGKLCKKGKGVNMILWEDTTMLDPKHIELTVFTKTGFVWVQNIWENVSLTGHKQIEYGRGGAAMIVEEIENGRRYRCNDLHPDEDFDDIVFTVTRIKH